MIWPGMWAVAAATDSHPSTGTRLPLVTIRQFLGNAQAWGETNELRLQGVVTASLADKTYFLQDGDAGVYVFHRPAEALQVGERVEVTGHPSLGNLKPILDGIAVRSRGKGGLPPAISVTFAEAMSGRHHMRLIRIQGRLAEERPRGGRNLVLNAGGSTNSFLADLEALQDYETLKLIEPGSILELTGVCNVRGNATRARPVSLIVFARSAADVVVLRGPPWWTPGRILVLLGVALGALGLALLWGWTLRRQVGRQTADLRARLEHETALEQRYRQLFETNPHPMMVYDMETTRFVAVNEAAIRQYGYSLAEFLNLTARDIRPPEDLPAFEKDSERAKPGLNAFGVRRHKKKDGQIIEVEVASHTSEFNGRPAKMVLALDVTARRQAEAALRKSEQYRRAIIEAGPESVKVIAADATLLDMNAAGLVMLEASTLDQVKQHGVLNFLRPEYRPAFSELHRRVMSGGSGVLEFEVEGLKGTRRWLETHAVLLPGTDGGEPALLGITRDITERKRAQVELHRTQERFATIFRTNPDAITIVSVEDERIVEVNPGFEQLMGYTAAEAVGKTTAELNLWVDPADRTKMIAWVKSRRSVPNAETRLRSKCGRVINALSSAEIIDYAGQSCIMSLTRDITNRKAAEEKLRRSEASLAAAQQIASLGSWELELSNLDDMDRNTLTWSDEVFRIFGHEPGAIEVTRKNFYHAVHPEDRKLVQDAVAEAIKSRGSYRIDHRIIRPDGSERIVQEYSEIILDPANGRPIRMLGVVQDITERKRAEAARHEVGERLRAIMDNSPAHIFLKDIKGRYLHFNREFARAFHLSPEQAEGKTDLDIFPAEQAAVFQANDRKVIESGMVLQFEETARQGDGLHTSIATKFPLFDSAGKMYAIGGIATDITKRVAAEQALRESRQRYAELVRTIDGIVWEADATTSQFTFVSEQAERLLGYPAKDWLEPGFWPAHIHPEDRDSVVNYCLAATRKGLHHELDYRMVAADGRTIWLRDLVTVVVEAGEPRLLRGVMVDITARREAEEKIFNLNAELEQRVARRTTELAEANKELESFSYSVSHDLRAPLRAIEGFSNILQQECAPQLEEKGLRYLDRVRAGTGRMGALIDGLLKLSRFTRAPMARHEVDLSQVVLGSLAELRTVDPGRHVTTVVAPGIKASADPSLLRAAVQNLIGNAWKYTSRRAQARIEFGELTRDGERVFFVRDDGAGFDMDFAGKLFGAFQRLHGVDEFEGTGIGLATVQRIIHRHGGRIWAEAAVDQGATFYFTLSAKHDTPALKP